MKKYTINIVILRKADGTYLAYSPDLNEAKPIPQALVISAMELANTDPDRAPPGMFAVFKDEIMKGMITTTIHGICDRCANPFDREIHFPIDVILVTELANEENEDEWVFPLEGDSADLDDIVRTVFVLNLDSKLLCKEDCKGLCHQCGKNLNEGPCNCQKELDPRFAALKQLLEK